MEIVIKQKGIEKVISFDKQQRSDFAMREILLNEGILGIFAELDNNQSHLDNVAFVRSNGRFSWGINLEPLVLPRIGYHTSETNVEYHEAGIHPCFEARIMEGRKKREYLAILISEYQRIDAKFSIAKDMALDNIIRVSQMPDDGKNLVQIDWSSSNIGEALGFPDKAFIVE